MAAQCGGSEDCARLRQSAPQRSRRGRDDAPAIACKICTRILTKLKSLVGNNTNEDNVVQAEDKLCKLLPRMLQKVCRNVITKFKAKIAEMLEAGGDARQICTKLRMCRKPPRPQGAPLPPSDPCELCLTFTSRAQPDLQSPAPGGDLAGVLNGTCKRHFGDSPTCNDFVSAYGAKLLTALMAPQDPLTLCLDTEACRLPEEPDQGDPSSGDYGWAWP
ncbi:granulysin [Emydura macquarii macquarii]|uniref:granulysin n=1 Tax=Emydura macquarii macquarii TaxID=1129001 RepID=UPI00352B7F4C